MKTRYSVKTEDITRKDLAVVLGIIFAVLTIGFLFAWGFGSYTDEDDGTGDGDNGDDDDDDDEPTPEFGDNTLEVEYGADAKLLSTDEETEVSEGVTTTSESDFFADDFESGDLSKWSVATDHITATDEQSYEGDWSCNFVARHSWSIDYLRKNNAFELDDDDGLNLYFAVNVSSSFEMTQAKCIHDDYFIVNIEFSNGKTVAYVIAGAYSIHNPNVAVIDINSQVEETDEWQVIKIENIQNDYSAHFGSGMPDSGRLKFQKRSWTGEVHIDAVLMYNETIPDEGGYWTSETIPILCYFVDVEFKVTIGTSINESNVWLGIWLWTTISNGEEDVEDDMLLQTALVNVSEIEEWMEWRSGCFALPENENIYGADLTYTFDIYILAYGQVKTGEPDEGDWIIVEGGTDEFDSFSVSWFSYQNYWLIILGTVLGGLGITGTAIGLKVRKKRNECPCLGDSDCYCNL